LLISKQIAHGIQKIYLFICALLLLTTKSDLEDPLSRCLPGSRLTTGGLTAGPEPSTHVSSILEVACTYYWRTSRSSACPLFHTITTSHI